jgi:hypothetical protein
VSKGEAMVLLQPTIYTPVKFTDDLDDTAETY